MRYIIILIIIILHTSFVIINARILRDLESLWCIIINIFGFIVWVNLGGYKWYTLPYIKRYLNLLRMKGF
jgi:hypothetical protein